MNERHNEIVAYVLDEPEEAARELERLRNIRAAALRVVAAWRQGLINRVSLDNLITTFDAQT